MDIKRLRYSSGLTQREFGMRYKIPLKTLQNWESDTGLPSSRQCPSYVAFLLEKAVMADFPVAKKLLEADIDVPHLSVIQQAKTKIRKSPLSEYVRDVLLYGSTARGQAKPSSDVDILLVLDGEIKKKRKCNDWISSLKGNISSDDYKLPETDLHVVFSDSFNGNKTAFFSNIRREGFGIWN